jgi:nucleotide-binding universal stress UspA family protein
MPLFPIKFPIKTLIVPTDFSEASDVAVRSAAALAHQDGAAVHLLHVIRLPFLHTTYDVNVPEAIWEGLRKGTDERLAEASRELEALGITDVHRIVSDSLQPEEAIAQSARDLDADLVVMATRDPSGMRTVLLGSVTARTVRSSPVPVLTVRGEGLAGSAIGRILLATDFSPHSERAAELACAFARRFGARLDVLHVLEESPAYVRSISSELAAFEDKARAIAARRLAEVGEQIERSGITAKTHLLEGRPGDTIVAEAERLEADLVVLGTHGNTGFARLALGSVAERTLRLSPCSVLTTRAGEA